MTKTFAIDVDQTLANSSEEFFYLLETYHGLRYKTSQLTEGFPMRINGGLDNFGLHYNDISALYRKVWDNWNLISPTESDLPSKIDKIKNLGFRIVIMTNRYTNSDIPVLQWLSHYGIEWDSMIMTRLPEGMNEKTRNEVANKSRLYYFDYLIDDNPRYVLDALHMGREAYLYDWPYNRSKVIPGIEKLNSVRVKNFDELIKIVEQNEVKCSV